MWLCSLWKSEEMEGWVEERATPGWIGVFLAECRGAQLRSRGALLGVFGWDLSLFLPLSYFFSLCSLLCCIDRERLQHCPVLEWLQGKPECLTLHFLPSVLFIPQPSHLSLSFLFNLHSVVSSLPSLIFTFLICVSSLSLAICLHSFSLFSIFLYVFPFSFLHHFCVLSFLFFSFFFFFTPLSRATCLSLQDGAVHP